jgi:hypothetical protein
MGGATWSDTQWHTYQLPRGFDLIARGSPYTYGAALERARALL